MPFADHFLELPDLFPARRAGEHCGSATLAIDFVGGPYHVRGLSGSQSQTVRERFGPYCRDLGREEGEDGGLAVRVDIFRAALQDFRDFDPVGWNTWIDLDYAPHWVRLAGRHFMGRLEWGPALQVALWTCHESGDDFLGGFENLFRVVVSYRLLEAGGVLLHSAGVIDDGEACVFLGRSGAGKSTLSKLSLEAGREVLSDDLNALVPSAAGGVVVEKLPFAGDCGPTATAGRYPLRGLYGLEKGALHALRAVTKGQALALLVACSPYVNSDPCRLDRLTANLVSMLETPEIGALTFAMDDGFWGVLRAPREVVG